MFCALLVNARTVDSVFHIAKSENRNQVHYGARVDAACRPAGMRPIYAYWRMHERGPNVREGLLGHEQPAYGIRSQRTLQRSRAGGSVRLRLRAWPDRPIKIELFRRSTGCAARGLVDIQRQPAVLRSIYVDLGFLFSVNYVLIHGVRIVDARAVHERLQR